jgi:hypothetical protein
MGQRWLEGYSADVEVYLLVRGVRHDVAQIGGGKLILRGNPDIPANTEATLVVIIDGVEERQDIVICEAARQEEPVAFF